MLEAVVVWTLRFVKLKDTEVTDSSIVLDSTITQ